MRRHRRSPSPSYHIIQGEKMHPLGVASPRGADLSRRRHPYSPHRSPVRVGASSPTHERRRPVLSIDTGSSPRLDRRRRASPSSDRSRALHEQNEEYAASEPIYESPRRRIRSGRVYRSRTPPSRGPSRSRSLSRSPTRHRRPVSDYVVDDPSRRRFSYGSYTRGSRDRDSGLVERVFGRRRGRPPSQERPEMAVSEALRTRRSRSTSPAEAREEAPAHRRPVLRPPSLTIEVGDANYLEGSRSPATHTELVPISISLPPPHELVPPQSSDRNRMRSRLRARSVSPPDDAARATPPIVVTADALASSMSLATSMYHTATPNVSASGLGRSVGDLGLRSAGASAGVLESAVDASKILLPGAIRGVTQLTIEELCEEIRSTPELSNAPIGDLYRREIPSGVQHEFILVRSVPQGRPSTWIRIDRAAKGYRERWRITSRYPADDTVRSAFAAHCCDSWDLIHLVCSGTHGSKRKP